MSIFFSTKYAPIFSVLKKPKWHFVNRCQRGIWRTQGIRALLSLAKVRNAGINYFSGMFYDSISPDRGG